MRERSRGKGTRVDTNEQLTFDGTPDPVPTPTLWAVHVQGPDDMIAAEDRAEADRRTAEINEAWTQFKKRPGASDNDPRWTAVVVPWPYSRGEHAEEVARGDERWLP